MEAAHAAIPKEKCGADIPQLRVPQVIAGCQRRLFMANYIFCGGPLIPANVAVMIWHLAY